MESLQQEQEQEPSNQEEQPPHDECRRREKKPRRIRLVLSRAYTILVLLISLILLFTIKNTDKDIQVPENKAAVDHSHAPPPTNSNQTTFKISQLGSLRSILSASIIGAGCNLFQLGMLIYCMVTGKDMEHNKYKVFFDYYSDKVVSLLLAASAGAGIGSMLDISAVRPTFKYVGSFFSLGKVSTTLLASAIVSTSVSSTCSAEALQDYKKTVVKGEKAVGMLGTWTNKAYNFCCMQRC